MIVPFFLLSAALQAYQFDQSVVWTPPADFRQQVLTKCSDVPARFGTCFAAQMKASGASPEALAFTHLLDNQAYIEAFRPVGVVAIAAVNYPFRANENNGLFLINGQPQAIDIDDQSALPLKEMKSDHAYQNLPQRSNATLWPGDRASVNDLLAIEFPNRSEQFIAGYRVQDGCHACAVLGQAFFSFAFDKTGKSTGTTFTGFTSSFDPKEKVDRKMLAVSPGTTFALVLPSNRTTGYSWKLSSLTDPKVVEGGDHHYANAEARGMPGEGGEEHWTFRALTPGQSTVTLEYLRLWEKNRPPAKTVVLTLNVR